MAGEQRADRLDVPGIVVLQDGHQPARGNFGLDEKRPTRAMPTPSAQS